jgi:hypothetical protein
LFASVRYVNDSKIPGRARVENCRIEDILGDLEAHSWELFEVGKRESDSPSTK